jgi:hypothetical protein
VLATIWKITEAKTVQRTVPHLKKSPEYGLFTPEAKKVSTVSAFAAFPQFSEKPRISEVDWRSISATDAPIDDWRSKSTPISCQSSVADNYEKGD